MADFKGYAYTSEGDYRFAVALPTGFAVNTKNRVSITLRNAAGDSSVDYPNLELSSTSESDLNLEGGEVGYLVLTETQYNAIVPLATTTFDNLSWFTDAQIDVYNTRFFPRVSTSTYYGYVLPVDDSDVEQGYNLYFSAVTAITESGEYSYRFETDTNTFTNINNAQFELVPDPEVKGLDDYFTQDGQIVRTFLPREDFVAVQSLFTFESEVGAFFLNGVASLQVFLFPEIPSNASTFISTVEGIDVAVGDGLYFYSNSGTNEVPILGADIHFAGIINNIEGTNIFFTTEPTSDLPSDGDFYVYGKRQSLETSGILGFFAAVKFTSDDTNRAELFSIGSESFLSSK